MSESKMTPGPWERIGLGQRDGKWWYQIVSHGRGVIILGDDASAEAIANARAIACLPELVEAAREAFKAAERRAEDAAIRAKLGVGEWEACLESWAVNLRRILARIDGEGE